MSTVVDARVDMHAMPALVEAAPGSLARILFEMLKDRARRGIGGEVRVDWPQGPDWLRENIEIHHALGGTGPQAAWVLSKLGARAIIALEDRHSLMLRQIPPGVLIVQDGELLEGASAVASEQTVPETFIFEYTAGKPVGDVTPKRSSRIIVRFNDRGLQDDSQFDRISTELAPAAAAGLLSGLNDVDFAALPEASERLFKLARAWQDAGLKTVHFELAGYPSKAALDHVLSALQGAVTSLGMSQSEFLTLYPDASHPMPAMIALGEKLQLRRVCVHADTWAAAVTRCDPGTELQALMAGCAIASARAACGAPVSKVEIAEDAQFPPLPFEGYGRQGDWSFVACSAPYIEAPQTTLGLGDSFTAGCLLILGRRRTAPEGA
ncbi:ADP-dependent glucokinase/phosphofructokinase [Sinorhizobium meliloti]|uniref:ADP-dependent glucokinase/phosphofructokinase n=1 Tax=Rhizobium meliloti TaxID=382 RepID=UPI001F38C5A9|nr:ADP-dependent glucokinase/phosphofructokinase [Sinorhizobium meliloti]